MCWLTADSPAVDRLWVLFGNGRLGPAAGAHNRVWLVGRDSERAVRERVYCSATAGQSDIGRAAHRLWSVRDDGAIARRVNTFSLCLVAQLFARGSKMHYSVCNVA